MPIKEERLVRKCTKDYNSAEITLPRAWIRYQGISAGDRVKILADSVVVVIPPSAPVEVEEKVRRFLEGKEE